MPGDGFRYEFFFAQFFIHWTDHYWWIRWVWGFSVWICLIRVWISDCRHGRRLLQQGSFRVHVGTCNKKKIYIKKLFFSKQILMICVILLTFYIVIFFVKNIINSKISNYEFISVNIGGQELHFKHMKHEV